MRPDLFLGRGSPTIFYGVVCRYQPFADDSAVRRVHREGIILAGGGRALLLQLAHPGVAAGVAAHSDYRRHRFRRLLDTLRLTLALAFGDEAQARQAAAVVNGMHARVRGPGYNALDPALLTWVLATLVDTSLLVHERFLWPLSPSERQAYYEDLSRIGVMLGIPEGYLPERYEEFAEYTLRTMAGLVVSQEGKEIVRELLRAPWWQQPAMLPARLLAVGLLPANLREQYGLAWGPGREAALRGVQWLSRLVVPRLPRRLRATPWFLLPPRRRGASRQGAVQLRADGHGVEQRDNQGGAHA